MAHKAIVLTLAGAAAAGPLHHPARVEHPVFPRQNPSASTSGVARASGTASGTASASAPSKSNFKCGPVEEFWNPTQDDWSKAKTDEFLVDWMKNNKGQIDSHKGTGGFASAFSQYAYGKTGVTCAVDGSSDCEFEPCDNPVINGLENGDTERAFYVGQSVKNLHAYFMGIKDAFQMSALLSAFNSDGWVKTFYKKGNGHDADDQEDQGITALKEIFNVLSVVIGVACVFAGPATIPALAALQTAGHAAIAGGIGGAGAVIAGGAAGAANIAMKPQSGGANNFAKAADVKTALGQTIGDTLTRMVEMNDKVMQGGTVDEQGSTIANFLDGGAFLNSSLSEVDTMKGFNAMLQGMAINRLWKANKIFVLGGGKCDDSDGIGKGPQNAKWCDKATNTAWYLYFWQANDVISTTSRQWGWAAMPPGMDQLGKGPYADIKVENVIESSVKAYKQSAFNYSSNVANDRMMDAVRTGKNNPLQQGAAWEGVFTIPVCNMTKAIPTKFQKKENVMMDFGHDNRMNWCGNICENDVQKTKDFIHAANMDKFESPQHYCDKKPEWFIG